MAGGGDIGEADGRRAASAADRSGLARLAPLALLALIAAAVIASGAHRHLSLDALVAHRAAIAGFVHDHPSGSVLGAGLLYAVVVALSIPGALVLTLACGFLFGAVGGAAVAAASATAGATLLFVVARSSVGDALRARAGPRLCRFAEGFRRDAFNYLLFLRLMPVAPFWLVNLAPAVLGVPTGVFVAATAIGILPATFAVAAIGAGLDGAIAARAAACPDGACAGGLAVGDLVTGDLVAGLAALALLSLLPVAVRAWRRRGAPR